MYDPQNSDTRPMINVLEEQVLKEAQRQIQHLPDFQSDRLCAVDVSAYVLNRMEPMYATNRDGWGYQREKALRRVSRDISKQVTQAIQRMLKAPPRMAAPLPETVEARSALNQVRALLKRPDLDWSELPQVIEELMVAARTAQIRAEPQGARDAAWY